MHSSILKNALTILLGIFLALVVLEVGLRIINPFEMRVRGNQIILPVNKVYELRNIQVPGLQQEVRHTKNSLGFRGPEPKEAHPEAIRIFAIGGSTTESFYQPDGYDWPAIAENVLLANGLNVWMNNAGLDGHSTFGHNILLNDFLIDLKPDIILVMAGLNDVSRLEMDETNIRRGLQFGSRREVVTSLAHYSEIMATMLHLHRVYVASRQGLRHAFLDFSSLGEIEYPFNHIDEVLEYQEEWFLDGFRARLTAFVETSLRNEIKPVLITQATAVGFGIDPHTGIDLAAVDLGGFSGALFWSMVEQYNDVIREIAKKNDLLLIDLARELYKNTLFFYDAVHMTDAGAAETGQIIGTRLSEWLEKLKVEG